MPLDRQQLLAALEQANHHRELAAHLLGVSRATVQRAMREHRIQPPRADARLDPAAAAQIRQSGGPLRETAERFRVSEATVYRVLIRETWRGVK